MFKNETINDFFLYELRVNILIRKNAQRVSSFTFFLGGGGVILMHTWKLYKNTLNIYPWYWLQFMSPYKQLKCINPCPGVHRFTFEESLLLWIDISNTPKYNFFKYIIETPLRYSLQLNIIWCFWFVPALINQYLISMHIKGCL